MLLTSEKPTGLEVEFTKINWKGIGLCEIRRRDEKPLTLKCCHTLYHKSNTENSNGGIGFLIHKKHIQNIVRIKCISERVAYVIISLNEGYNMKIIQVHNPTSDHEDEELERLYGEIEIATEESRIEETPLNGSF